MATIWYGDHEKGELWYVKSTLADAVGYKKSEDDFPDQSTADQFFGERQFEAYRELGYQLGKRMLVAEEGSSGPGNALPEADSRGGVPEGVLAKQVGGQEGQDTP